MKLLDCYREIRKSYVNHIWNKYHQSTLPLFYDNGLLAQQKRDGYYSQCGQDFFLYSILFHYKNEGFFLDIGGNNPIFLSNTYFFEKQGWKGYAFEPQSSLCELWKKERKTPCFPFAVGEIESEISFTQCTDDYMSGVTGYTDTEGTVIKVKQIVLKDWLKSNQITKVDFISIDVEGYEMNVLKGIDFSKVDIKCIVIENNRDNGYPNQKIRKFIEEQGYVLVARLSIDDVFYKKCYLNEIYG
jgi:FkbM family methyltransferase